MQNNNSSTMLKNIMRIISLALIALFFIPSCVVSCATVEIPVSGLDAVIGVSYEGEKVTEPNFLMLLAVVIPIVMIIVLFSVKGPSIPFIILNAVDIVVWILFIIKAKDLAEQSYCQFRVTPWYIIMMLLIVANIVLAVLLLRIDSRPDYGMGSMPSPYMNSAAPPMGGIAAPMGGMAPPVYQQPAFGQMAQPAMQKQEEAETESWVKKMAVVCPLSPEHNGMKIPLGNEAFLIGRNAQECALVYGENAAGVSDRHCQVAFDKLNLQFVITDLGSAGGTFLMNGQKLNANVPYRLSSGESFYIGDPSNVIRVEYG